MAKWPLVKDRHVKIEPKIKVGLLFKKQDNVDTDFAPSPVLVLATRHASKSADLPLVGYVYLCTFTIILSVLLLLFTCAYCTINTHYSDFFMHSV